MAFSSAEGRGHTGHQEVNGFQQNPRRLAGRSLVPARSTFTPLLTTESEDLGFSRPSSEAALILDHAEGVEPDNVTGRFYRSDPAIARKARNE